MKKLLAGTILFLAVIPAITFANPADGSLSFPVFVENSFSTISSSAATAGIGGTINVSLSTATPTLIIAASTATADMFIVNESSFTDVRIGGPNISTSTPLGFLLTFTNHVPLHLGAIQGALYGVTMLNVNNNTLSFSTNTVAQPISVLRATKP